MKNSTATLSAIIGNRDFFPDQLVAEARNDIQKLVQQPYHRSVEQWNRAARSVTILAASHQSIRHFDGGGD